MKRFPVLKAGVVLVAFLLAVGCANPLSSGSSGGSGASNNPASVAWAWAAGSNTRGASGLYGTKGVPNAGNVPGARANAASWSDESGNLWLFGGWGRDSEGSFGPLNDLWRFDGSAWTWASGSLTRNAEGVYGTRGGAAPQNVPGAREGASSLSDESGNLWLFGGDGRDSEGNLGGLNDLWRFDGSHWMWVSGSTTRSAEGVYGTRGVAAPENVPGAREDASSWHDKSGNLWLFGGWGRDSEGNFGRLNDLWRFDGSMWTWVSGSATINAAGGYGTQGIASPGNVPGGRTNASSWSDESGNLWLFGGFGYDSGGAQGFLNDLWRFDGSEWTWVSGSDTRGAKGEYGTQGVAAPENVPGAREDASSWHDKSGNLWLFGGFGRDSEVNFGRLNDLWRFDGSEWTWVSGSDTPNAAGEYGTRGVAAPQNVPGAREGASSWRDGSGNLWLFGGSGRDSGGNTGRLNDLWRFAP